MTTNTDPRCLHCEIPVRPGALMCDECIVEMSALPDPGTIIDPEECDWCGEDIASPECGHDPETGERSGELAEERAQNRRDERWAAL